MHITLEKNDLHDSEAVSENWSASDETIIYDPAVEKMLMQEIGYIYDDEFEKLSLTKIKSELSKTDLYEGIDGSAVASPDFPSYLAALYDIPLLTVDGERVLFRAMNYYLHLANQKRSSLNSRRYTKRQIVRIQEHLQTASDLRQQIVKSNLRLVVSIARKYSQNPHQLEEMICEGNFILLKAVDKFDYALGYRFSTYVTHSVQRHLFRFMKKRQRIRTNEVDFPDSRSYENLGIEEAEDSLLEATRSAHNLMDCMKDVLDDREQFLIRERFGFDGDGKTRTLKSLAGDMGICKERVRQLLNKALNKLNEFAAENPNVINPL
ncbi:RNA polymerase sigma factor SigA [Polystyrenella longa]|uniref:RNA polymerase sigma factor SigA n=1 Tax=Polystyrenella longa TaxID=2528007 RepID=A0A518CNI2_9PLAN|nr:sigma-70 family RNA polymerase sigma factor [Polystyrenella longa]QDU80785.1 RNA polymerase sigma factor SigA [Polystyrenella longa]